MPVDQRIAKELLDPKNERFISNLPRHVIADFETNATIWNLVQHTGGLICEAHHVCDCPYYHPTLNRGPRNCLHWHKYTEAKEGGQCRTCHARLVPLVPMAELHSWQQGVGLRVTSADGGRSKQLVEIGRGSPGEIIGDEKNHYTRFGQSGPPVQAGGTQVHVHTGNGSSPVKKRSKLEAALDGFKL